MHLLEVRDLQTVFQTDGKRSGQSTMYRFSPIPVKSWPSWGKAAAENR